MASATPPISYGVSMNTLKSRILNPALTSHYSVIINPPSTPTGTKNASPGVIEKYKERYGTNYDSTLMELTCIEASLPGSNLGTIETMDYAGITEHHAYRRIFDDTIDFTFLVTQDSNYHQIRFFDTWMKFIVREGEIEDAPLESNLLYNRARYPKDYQGSLSITKFEKNLGVAQLGASTVPILTYRFLGAYPKQINSVPVSYEASDLLKVTVSFTYTRYYLDETSKVIGTRNTNNSNSPGNPEVPSETAQQRAYRLRAANYLTPNSDALANQRIEQPFNLRGFGTPARTTQLGGPQQA